RRADFIFAAVGAAIGLGNVWRFPYIAFKYGGGAFLIPYFVALLTAGIPLLILEFGLGRMMQAGAPAAFAKVRKNFEWIGWLSLFAVMLIFFYYTVIMAWCWNYVVFSVNIKEWAARSEQFFKHDFLRLTSGPGHLGHILWYVVIGLAISWLWSFFYLRHGPISIGKEIYFTVIIPWIILVILVIRGLTLPGAIKGLNYYLTPNFAALKNPETWLAAYGQIFFTLSLAMGTQIVYSSYLERRTDVNNNAIVTALANCGTSFFAGFAVFSVLGFAAQALGVPVPEVTKGGLHLAFITYPRIISMLPAAPVLGVLFFILLVTLAIDSQISQVEPFICGFMDKWRIDRKKILPIVAVCGFLVGLIFATRGGYYWVDIIDHVTCEFGLTLVGILEAIAIGWFFGARKFREYVNEVSEIKIGRWWDICVMIITPLILLWSFIFAIYREARFGYGDYPRWAGLTGIGIIILIIIMSFVLMKLKGREG
ncbi:sodium-dependent transporter, partial [archaeon]